MKRINAADYGASPDNPDNTEAIQAAIDALTAVGGGGLILPSGILRVRGAVTWPHDVRHVFEEEQ